MLLGPSVFTTPFLRYFRGEAQKFGDSGSTVKNATDEPKLMKERGDTELSAAILGRHPIVYKLPLNSCVISKSLFCE